MSSRWEEESRTTTDRFKQDANSCAQLKSKNLLTSSAYVLSLIFIRTSASVRFITYIYKDICHPHNTLRHQNFPPSGAVTRTSTQLSHHTISIPQAVRSNA